MEENNLDYDFDNDEDVVVEEEEKVEEKEPEEPEEEVNWQERALKAERLIQKNKEKAKERKSLEVKSSKKGTVSTDELMKRIELQEEREDMREQGYSKSELDYLSRLRKEGETLADVAKNDYAKIAIEGMRKASKNEEATPSPSHRVEMSNGKTAKEVMADPKATDAEKQSAYEAFRSKPKGGVNHE